MSKPWMPLYVAEYKKDTGHLSVEQHGAYMLLIMHYWATGGLPDDDAQLARITCQALASWKRMRSVIQAFFHDGWKHKRVDHELAHAESVSTKRRAAVDERERKRTSNDASNDHQMMTQSQSPSHLQEKEVSNFRKPGERKTTGWSPPRHGAQSTKHRTTYIKFGTPEWPLYDADHQVANNGKSAIPDEHGGFWFPTCGATTIPPPKRFARA